MAERMEVAVSHQELDREAWKDASIISEEDIDNRLSEVKRFVDGDDLSAEALQGHEWIYRDLTRLYLYHPESFFHTGRVTRIYQDLGASVGDYPIDQLHVMTRAGWTHDLGKLDVPYHILNKPAELDETERTIMQSHLSGSVVRLLENREWDVMDIVIGHHMSGKWPYPEPELFYVDDEGIEEMRKRLILSDVTDVLLSDRVYKKRTTPEEAIASMTREKLDQPELIHHAVGFRSQMQNIMTLS